MPEIFRVKNLRFFFYSNEGTPREPLHIHVRAGHAKAKIWLEPTIGLAENIGFKSHELSAILKHVIDNRFVIRRAWHDYFSN